MFEFWKKWLYVLDMVCEMMNVVLVRFSESYVVSVVIWKDGFMFEGEWESVLVYDNEMIVVFSVVCCYCW